MAARGPDDEALSTAEGGDAAVVGLTRKAIAEKLNVSERSVYRPLAGEEEVPV